jgi:hypothetical protein
MASKKYTHTQSEIDSFNGRIVQRVIDNGYSDTLGKLLAAQANYESGHYSNPAFNDFNNLSGYKNYGSKPNQYEVSIGNKASDGGTYAGYAALENSVDEILGWLEKRQKDGFVDLSTIQTPEDYVKKALLGDKAHQWFTNGIYPPTQKQINDYILGMSTISQKLGYIYSQNKTLIDFTLFGILTSGVAIYYYYRWGKSHHKF